MRATQIAAREALAACVRVERSKINIVSGLRVGIVALVVLLVSIRMDHFALGASVCVGVLLAPVSDVADSFPVRARLMLWTTMWLSIGAFIGGLVSEYRPIHLVTAFAAAAVCGFSGALGPRAAMIGVMALAVFTVYAGSNIGAGVTVIDTLAIAAGGLLITGIVCLPWPLHRFNGLRTSVAVAFREFALAADRRGDQLAAPVVAAAVGAATTAIDHSGAAGSTRAWFTTLLSALGEARVALQAMIFLRDREPDYVEGVTRSAGSLARGIGRALTYSGQRHHLPGLIAALKEAGASPPTAEAGILADALITPLVRAAEALMEPWPIGSRATTSRVRVVQPSAATRLRAHLSWSDVIAEHTLRLTATYGVATALAFAVHLPNAYWFPLTVAWITKPDLGGTILRISLRVTGTIAGVLLCALVISLHPGDVALAVFVAIGCYIAIAYLIANYAIAVMGITILVVLLDTGLGQDGSVDAFSRCLMTIVAGIFVLAVALIRPRRGSAAILAGLTGLAEAVRAYTDLVRQGRDTSEARAAILRHRTTAVAAINVAVAEPSGLWERPTVVIDTGTAALIFHDYLRTTSAVLAEEILRDHGHDDAALWQDIDESLADLDARVDSLAAGSRPLPPLT